MMRILNRAPKNPYTRTTYGGHTVNWRTRAMLMVLGQRLYGDPYSLFVAQGSYNPGGVGASGGTHDGGGAVDLSANDKFRKVKIGREIGFRIWYRSALPGVWGEHCHAIAAGDQEMSAAAHDQIVQYANHTNGLADHGPDNFPFHPNTVFNYQAWRKKYNARQADWFAMAEKSDLKEVVDAGIDRVLTRFNEVAGNVKERDEALAARLGKVVERLNNKATHEEIAAARDELLGAIADVRNNLPTA